MICNTHKMVLSGLHGALNLFNIILLNRQFCVFSGECTWYKMFISRISTNVIHFESSCIWLYTPITVSIWNILKVEGNRRSESSDALDTVLVQCNVWILWVQINWGRGTSFNFFDQNYHDQINCMKLWQLSYLCRDMTINWVVLNVIFFLLLRFLIYCDIFDLPLFISDVTFPPLVSRHLIIFKEKGGPRQILHYMSMWLN